MRWFSVEESVADCAALLAPSRPTLTYAGLELQVSELARALAASGIERSARIATMLPAGPEAAVAFLGTSSAAVCAPLNPELGRGELEFFLEDLSPAAFVVAAELVTPARDVATRLRIPIAELTVNQDAPAGRFELDLSSLSRAGLTAPGSESDSGDVALMLHTSGTTGRPKIVPLTHGNLRASAKHVVATLGLGAGDRCLNVMPLFHIHGLVGALLSSLHARASVVCTSGFRSDAVVQWINELRPTWYTAVPTIHQAMVVAARRSGPSAPDHWPFRLIRSSSAALAPALMAELEDVFGAPVIESYGMTEAAHQVASNPLPPRARKPGSVGPAAGPEVAVRSDDGRILMHHAQGEIVIRGPNVTAGYAGDPTANRAAFSDGWFLTGDLGALDGDGYLVIQGRRKEMINRGGEKIAPREVDDVLLDHPDVAQAVTFPVPHPRLGEEVAAAVVLTPGSAVTKGELRQAVAARLAAFKVPRHIVVVDGLPKGPTGKLQRIGLAERLGLDDAPSATSVDDPGFVAPRDELETKLAAIVQDVLALDHAPSVTDDIFALGADSLHVVELMSETENAFGRTFPESVLLDDVTIEKLVASLRTARDASHSVMVESVQPAGSEAPLFCLVRGGSMLAIRRIAVAIGPDRPVYAISMPMMHGTWRAAGDITDLAHLTVAAVREQHPHGPYAFFGHSFGGLVVYEAARQLASAGEPIELVALGDAEHPDAVRRRFWPKFHPRRMAAILLRRGPIALLRSLPWPTGSWARHREYVPGTDIVRDRAATNRRERRYFPGALDARVALVQSERSPGPDWFGWDALVTRRWELHRVPGSHDSMLGEPHVYALAATLATCLRNDG
jgi:oxalate---CoA ligase